MRRSSAAQVVVRGGRHALFSPQVVVRGGRHVSDPAASNAGDANLPAMRTQYWLTSLRSLRCFENSCLRPVGVVSDNRGSPSFSPSLLWRGPAGLGTFTSHAEFDQLLQREFLQAIPDWSGGHHFSRISEKNFVATAGWPSIFGTHSGRALFGVEPLTGPGSMSGTGEARAVRWKEMAFWRVGKGSTGEGQAFDELAEAWVFLDLFEIYGQLGVDLWEAMDPATTKDREAVLLGTGVGDWTGVPLRDPGPLVPPKPFPLRTIEDRLHKNRHNLHFSW